MIVVSDTSPVLNLGRIGRLDLLRSLYGEVRIPPGVISELVNSGVKISDTHWLSRTEARDQASVQHFRRKLDLGEAEAIALAIELRAGLVLIDERRGRRIAAEAGLRVMGLLGILTKAKDAALIDRVKPVLDELIQVAHFWIGRELYSTVLAELGEA